jgi:transposase
LINSARSIAKGFGLRLPKSITATFGERAVEALPEFLRTALAGLLKQIDAISGEIAGYDQKLGELAGKHPELARLESIPGVGRLTAMTFVLTLGRAERFAHSRDVAGFLRLRPKKRQSGARDPQLGISKSGDPSRGLGEGRGREESHVARDRRGGQKVIRAAAPVVGERRIL